MTAEIYAGLFEPNRRRYLKYGIEKTEDDSEIIKRTVAKYYHLESKDLETKCRKASLAFPRQVAMYFLRKRTDLTHRQIGSMFGNRHHSTVIYSFQYITDQMSISSNFTTEIAYIESLL